MNRHRRRPLKLQLRAAPQGKVVYRDSPKLSLKILLPAVLLALVILGALGFALVNVVKNARSKHLGVTQTPAVSATTTPLLVGTENPVPVTPKPTPAGIIAAKATPSPSSTPVSRPTASVAAASPSAVKPPSESARKTAEQGRRQAERKRTRLEAQFKSHQISEEAYKKGQEEYKTEMAKYRSVVAGSRSPSD
jgi:hypothetical protein